jgi:beta-galactosidase
MEHYGQGYGYIAYTTTLNRDYKDTPLRFQDLGDRAQIYVNRTLQGIVYVNDEELKTTINAKAGDTLTILVENMGRANFGPKMMRKKGIAGRLLLGDNIIHFNWQVYPLPMDNLDKVVYGNNPTEPTRFYKGTLNVDKVADTFIRLDDFTKGFILVNGFNIGRYWEIGPQKNYYIPACLLKEGANEIVVFESDGAKKENPTVEFLDKPDLG